MTNELKDLSIKPMLSFLNIIALICALLWFISIKLQIFDFMASF